MTHRIAVIGGDGIGPEVTAEALKVLRAAGADIDTTDFDLGGGRYLRDGEVLSEATIDAAPRASTPSCSARPAGPTSPRASSNAG